MVFFLQKTFSQSVSVTQDARFEQLLSEKRKINASITINDSYKIQIYNGDSETSKKTLIEFKKNNKNYDATVVFFTPIYKVWVGNFKTRIDAERNLIVLKKNYPNAFLIKPNR
jgi:hypothetical protein